VLAIPKGPWWMGRDSDCIVVPYADAFGAIDFELSKRKVRILIMVFRARKQDPTNARASVKELEDALVKRGWAVDDTEEWLDLRVAEEVDRKNQRTIVEWQLL
jgi:hypothetical protein